MEFMPTQSRLHSPLGTTWTGKNNNLAGTGVGEGMGMGGRERRKPEGDVGAGGVVRVFSGPAPPTPRESGCTWGRCDVYKHCLPKGICVKWAQERLDAQRPQSRRGRVGRTMADQVLCLSWFRRERSSWE